MIWQSTEYITMSTIRIDILNTGVLPMAPAAFDYFEVLAQI